VELTSILLSVALVAVTASALFVFVSAARFYVSEEIEGERNTKGSAPSLPALQARNGERRRNRVPVVFPVEINGMIIEQERRSGVDRRDRTIH
jgi:hypothetical protein